MGRASRNFGGKSFECYELRDTGTSFPQPRSLGQRQFSTGREVGSYEGGKTYIGKPVGSNTELYFKVPN